MRNEEFTTKTFIDYLRETATEDATEEDFPVREHTAWMAADRLEDLVALLLSEDVPSKLRSLADILEGQRECVWADKDPWWMTACGRKTAMYETNTDRPCWCGGKVRVAP